MLKADFHLHTGEDKLDTWIRYSAKDIINRASRLGFDVLSITNHGTRHYSDELKKYAKARGILLIPGIEAWISGKEVLIINAPEGIEEIRTFSELRNLKKQNKNMFVIAPHPFYPKPTCVNKDLFKHNDVFEGVEYSHYYCKIVNPFNKKAIRAARKYCKTLVGTSDAHQHLQFNKTYSMVDADKNINSVINALKKNKIKIKTRRLSYFECVRAVLPMIKKRIKGLF